MKKKNDILYNLVVNLSKEIIKSSGTRKRKYRNYDKILNNFISNCGNVSLHSTKNTLTQDDISKAELCYITGSKLKPLHFKNYELDHDLSDFYHTVYVNVNKKKCVMTCKGTQKNNVSDILADFYIILGEMEKSGRFGLAEIKFDEIYAKYKPQKYKFELNGFSLGGALALHVFSKNKRKVMLNTVFNPGISPFTSNKILHSYVNNKKNRFIYKLGDIISNTIIRKAPKNFVLMSMDLNCQNLLQNHKLSNFYIERDLTKQLKKDIGKGTIIYKDNYNIKNESIFI